MTRAHRFHAALRSGAMLLLAAFLAGAPGRTAQAGWSIDGVPVGVGALSQHVPAVCSDGAGGAFIVFRHWGPGVPEALRAQRLDFNGNALWAAGGVAVAPSTGNQRVPSLLSMGDGGAMIAWQEDHNGAYDVYVQRLTGSGTVAPGWPAGGVALAHMAYHETNPVIASDGAGGAFVAWEMWYSLTDPDIYAGHISGGGVVDALWPDSGLPVAYSSAWQDVPAVLSDHAGGCYIAWRDSSQGTQESDVFATRLLANATSPAGWSGGKTICSAPGRQGVPSLATDGAGGFIAAWRDFRSDAQGDIWATRMSANGAEAWSHNGVPVCVEANAQGDNGRVPIVSDGDGGAIVAWSDDREPLATGYDIYAQLLDAGTGAPAWTANGVPMCVASGLQGGLDMCADESGGAFLVWGDQRAGLDVYAQHVVHDGRIGWPLAGLTYCTAAGDQTWPVVCSDQNGGAIMVWEDRRNGDNDIYAGSRSGRTNLIADDTHAGWDAPAVPRNLPGATAGDVHVTPVLDGNAATTWINYHTWFAGTNPLPMFQTSCLIDGLNGWTTTFGDAFLPLYWMGLNMPPLPVTGGRHTVSLTADDQNVIPETSELDNAWMGQWVWSPLPLGVETPLERDLPATWGDLALPNVDGLAFTRPHTNMAWVVSLAPVQAGTDCDLYLFDDYTGSTSGFSHFVGASNLGVTHTDFVVGHYTTTPQVYYAGACTYGTSRSGKYVIDAAESEWHMGPSSPMDWMHVTMPPKRLADVYELYMPGGTTNWVSVAREDGGATLELSGFPSAGGGVYGRASAGAVSIPVTASVAQLTYMAPLNGWYPLVVYRDTGEEAGAGVRYSLHWATHPLVDVPEPPVAAATLAFEGVRPNPMQGSTALAFTLSRGGPVRIEVFDARGRLVRLLSEDALEAGAHRVVWDGRTDAGSLAPSGIHWVRLTAEGRSFVRKVALVR